MSFMKIIKLQFVDILIYPEYENVFHYFPFDG